MGRFKGSNERVIIDIHFVQIYNKGLITYSRNIERRIFVFTKKQTKCTISCFKQTCTVPQENSACA